MRCHSIPVPPHRSVTVWLAGSPYTCISSGYVLVESKSGGRIIQPSSVTPSPTCTRKNSTGVRTSGATAAFNAAFSASTRTAR